MKINDKYYDGYLKQNLDVLKEYVAKKWDGVIHFAGYEGDGKTTIAAQVAHYLDPTINLERVVFNGDEFKKACDVAKPGQAIIFDESHLAFSSKSVMQKETKLLIHMLTVIRKKGLYLMIVSPDFFDVTKYIAIHRSRALIYVYTNGFQRGNFGFFNRERKKTLYLKGKKNYDIHVVKPNFTGRFTKWFPFDTDEYEVKKDKAIEAITMGNGKVSEVKSAQEQEREEKAAGALLMAWLNNRKLLKLGAVTSAAEGFFGVGRRTLYKMMDKHSNKIRK